MGKIINLKEAARRLGVTDQTIKNWIAKGAISMKRVGGAQYVDEDTVAALQDTAEDIERQKRILEQLREQQRQETKAFMDAMHDKESRRRYYALCVETGIRTEFFATILEMMEYYGTLSAREAGEYELQTREGCPVKVLCWDKKGSDPIVGIQIDGEYEYGRNWQADGHLYPHRNSQQDLVLVKVLNGFETRLRDLLMIPISNYAGSEAEQIELAEGFVDVYGDAILEEARILFDCSNCRVPRKSNKKSEKVADMK